MLHSIKQKASAMPPARRLAIIWLAAAMFALILDGPIAHAAVPIATIVKNSAVADQIKEAGHFIFVMILAAFVWILHPAKWRGAALLMLSGISAGIVYTLAKWPIGRIRPIKFIDPFHFEPFRNGLDGFMNAPNASFPSGHACLAFATAACMSWLLPRGRWAFFTCAALLATERVLELAHYLSDVIAGAALGILAFHLTRVIFQAMLQPPAEIGAGAMLGAN